MGSSAGSGVFGLAGCFGAIFLGGTLPKTAQPEHTTNALRDQGGLVVRGAKPDVRCVVPKLVEFLGE